MFADYISKNKWIYPLLAVLFFIVFLINQNAMLNADKTVPYNDWAIHYTSSLIKHEFLRNLQIGPFLFHSPAPNYPPLTLQITAFFFMFTGTGVDQAVLSQWIYWAIMFFSIYFSGSHLWNSETGLFASIFSLSIPYCLRYDMMSYFLDFPCGAMVALCILFLLKSDTFRNGKYTILFFISLGLGLLTKWAVIIFIAPASLMFFINMLWQRKKENKSWDGILIGFLLSSLVIWGLLYLNLIHPGYGVRLWTFIGVCAVFIITLAVYRKDPQLRCFFIGYISVYIMIWGYYSGGIPHVLIHFTNIATEIDDTARINFLYNYLFNYLRWPRAFMFITGLILACYDLYREKSTKKAFFLISTLTGLYLLNIQPVRFMRYYSQIMVFTSITATFWIVRIKIPPIRIAVKTLFAVLCILSLFAWKQVETLRPELHPDINLKIIGAWENPLNGMEIFRYNQDFRKAFENMPENKTVILFWLALPSSDQGNVLEQVFYTFQYGMKNFPSRIYWFKKGSNRDGMWEYVFYYHPDDNIFRSVHFSRNGIPSEDPMPEMYLIETRPMNFLTRLRYPDNETLSDYLKGMGINSSLEDAVWEGPISDETTATVIRLHPTEPADYDRIDEKRYDH